MHIYVHCKLNLKLCLKHKCLNKSTPKIFSFSSDIDVAVKRKLLICLYMSIETPKQSKKLKTFGQNSQT